MEMMDLAIIAMKVVMKSFGDSDHSYYRGLYFNAPTLGEDLNNFSSEMLFSNIELFFYGGIYNTWNSSVRSTTNMVLGYALSNIKSGGGNKSARSIWLQTGSIFQDSLMYLASNWFFQQELTKTIGFLQSPKVSSLQIIRVGSFPSRHANSSIKDASKGQRFQFFFRSLKPSIWKKDITPLSTDPPAIPAIPKGILRMPHSISNFGETYNATWNQQNILGSSQKLHKYQYTDRSVNLTVELFSNSLVELRYNIWRLNWLSEHVYGKLSTFKQNPTKASDDSYRFSQEIEFVEYPFIKATVGTVLVEVPCYITSLGVNYHMDAGWELGDDILNRQRGEKDLQWPHWITVSLSMNILYDKMDPSTSTFYSQDPTGTSLLDQIKYGD